LLSSPRALLGSSRCWCRRNRRSWEWFSALRGELMSNPRALPIVCTSARWRAPEHSRSIFLRVIHCSPDNSPDIFAYFGLDWFVLTISRTYPRRHQVLSIQGEFFLGAADRETCWNLNPTNLHKMIIYRLDARTWALVSCEVAQKTIRC
jgi:hypothetical protein